MSADLRSCGEQWPPVVWVEPWNDPHTESTGVAVRSPYVEKYWTSVLGPTQVLLLRHIADQFDKHPDGFEMGLSDTSVRLGVSPVGGKGALRSLYRLERFRLVAAGHSLWVVRRSLPVLSRQHLLRLPHELRASHSKDARAAAALWDGQAAERAGRTALLLARKGESAESIVRRLEAMNVPPAACVEAARAAVELVADLQHELGPPAIERTTRSSVAEMAGI
ncbi:MAG: hypothetical protein F4015_06425 [Acidimicrobiia bacterium]|nr:hypothetical protein [Acidimicrobiia bacterium]MYL09106.1 hypothetical protein [Acidimicrobiia bacterium]